ncbi:MAG: ComF family protein [Armatimonadota bacterium]|nr:ComF family protein [Armatimonadota bacterium]
MPSYTVSFLQRFWEGVLDIVYPPFCLICGTPNQEYLCTECTERIIFIEYPFCRRCGGPRVRPAAAYCECTDREYWFEQARSVGVYEGVLRDAIHALKYDLRKVMADPLARLMIRAFPNLYAGLQPDLVIPIPIHSTRLLERGFNQSSELGKRLAQELRIPFNDKLLVKHTNTPDQIGLPEQQRALNVRGAFAVTRTKDVLGNKILLVDDVFTTGATANEAARTLRQAGASSVYIYTVARSI